MNVTKPSFKIEVPPFKSKKLPKTPAYPLPAIGGICWCLCARRQSGKTIALCSIVREYARSMSAVIIFSPTIRLDSKWKSVMDYKNVLVSDKISNEVLMELLERQKRAHNPDKPMDSQIMVVIDDFASIFKRSELRQSLTTLVSNCRHFGINLIFATQSIMFLESIVISNVVQWSFWNTNKRHLKKVCLDLATNTCDEDQLEAFISDNTVKPYSFVYINYLAEPDKMFWKNFDEPWTPEKRI